MTKTKIFFTLILCILLSIPGYAGSFMEITGRRVVEKNEIILEVNKIYKDELDYLEISGFTPNSAQSFKKTEVLRNKDGIRILVYAGLVNTSKNERGDFNITIPVEKNINKVFFGNKNELIWERKTAGN